MFPRGVIDEYKLVKLLFYKTNKFCHKLNFPYGIFNKINNVHNDSNCII